MGMSRTLVFPVPRGHLGNNKLVFGDKGNLFQVFDRPPEKYHQTQE